MQRRWVAWLLVFAGWTALAVFFAASSSLTYVSPGRPPRFGFTLLMSLTEWYAWAALTPIVAWLATRFPLRRGSIGRSLAVHVPLGLLLAVLKLVITRILRAMLVGTTGYFLIDNLATHYAIYWAIVAAVHALAYQRAGREDALRASRLEASLADARLQLLKMQLHPHFLFNTLNTISELVHEDPDTADRMITALSQLLREALHAGMVDVVELSRELNLLDKYIEIQRARFGDRLDVRMEIEDSARTVLVPHLILQPLVENAIRHGIGKRVRAGRIHIRARRSIERLVLEVEDDGAGLGAADAHREGVGLGNTRARLQELYGGKHSVELLNVDAGGTCVRLTIPCTAPAPGVHRP
jgi:two-component system, LytTR family, sensor kinase